MHPRAAAQKLRIVGTAHGHVPCADHATPIVLLVGIWRARPLFNQPQHPLIGGMAALRPDGLPVTLPLVISGLKMTVDPLGGWPETVPL